MAISPEIHQDRESCLPEILNRVPASQLGNCLLVSKKWYSLLTSSAFMSSHCKTQNQLQSSNLFIIRSISDKNPLRKHNELFHFCSFNNSPTKQTQTLQTLINKTVKCPFKTELGLEFRMVGSVNGVIFLSDEFCGFSFANEYSYILWNPLVNCYINLPKPRACYETVNMYMDALGFGYDGVNDDFKVVRLVYPQLECFEWRLALDKVPPLAEVYSVKEGKWRSIYAGNVEYCTVDIEWSQCFLNGNVHWVAYERWGEDKKWSRKSSLLLLFNVEKEKFLIMKLPLELRDFSPLSLVVSERQGLLCVHQYLKTEVIIGGLKHEGYNLWVKKEYNKAVSWVKVASVDFKGDSVMKDVYWLRNGKLPCMVKDSELVSFDPETNEVVVLESGCRAHYETWSFAESLAFLNKDCKNKRTIHPKDIENGSNDEEEVTPDDLRNFNMKKYFCTWYQLVVKFNPEVACKASRISFYLSPATQ